VVAREVNPRQDLAVRTLATVVLLAGGVAVAGEGRVVRVERPPSREVFVPAGTFEMGVTDKEAEDAVEHCRTYYESPNILPFKTPSGAETKFCSRYAEELAQMDVRDVTLGAFAIDRDEVTVADYRKCVAAGACELDPLVDGDERYIQDAWPIVNITWFEARDFCRWHGGRLPTEAEWERAARGDDGRVWPWGKVPRPGDFNHGKPRDEGLRQLDRFTPPVPIDLMGDPDDSDHVAVLAPPGTFPWGEGPYGTRDMAGNVAEWTADLRGENDATLGYNGLPRIDPKRDSIDKQNSEAVPRVVRGGSWRQPEYFARANLRDPFHIDPGTRQMYLPTQRFSHVGFRCARSLGR
jgi:formylglycine-generating enzyme required for sulfatase activity